MNPSKFDFTMIKTLGLGLTDQEEEELLEVLPLVLDRRITGGIFELLDEPSAKQFGEMLNKEPIDESSVFKFIDEHVPDHDELAQDAFDILMGEVLKNPKQFLGLLKPEEDQNKA